MSTLDALPPLRAVIAAHGLSARKSLGQNFLLDLNLTRRIARAGGPLAGATVIEVGPGPGGLTRALLMEGAEHVIAIERDTRCMPALAEIAAAVPDRLTVIEGDALEIDERALLAARGVTQVRLVSNLPYHVGTALLIKWLTADDWPPFWSSLTLMFQREVAERIVAQPRDEAYGRLSILSQWRAQAKLLFDVNRSAFTPPPNVTSAIVRLEPLAEPVAPCARGDLERVTQAAFSQRRKMLRQSLKSLGVPAEALCAAADVLPTARAEEIDIAGFAALARAYAAIAAGGPARPQ